MKHVPNFVRLTFEPEDEWRGQLFAHSEADGFGARGSAWLRRDSLVAFGWALGRHPVPSDPPVAISGGIHDRAGGGAKDVHLGLAVIPAGRVGALQAHVTLASDTADAALRQRAALCFVTDYASVDRFRRALVHMLENGGEAVLNGTEAPRG